MTTATTTWRVVLENGAIGCLGVGDAGGGWRDVGGRQYHPATPLRAAIAHAAWERDWSVEGIVAPGAPTADERVAALTAERDAARRAATLAETERDALRAENERLKATGGEGR